MLPVTYRFADIQIDPLARELRRNGELVALSPKVFDCLVYLIEHRDRAVGRDELIAAIWGKIDVTDTLLGQTLLKARRTVGDDGSGQHAIRTIPRFGYRWVGEIEVESQAAAHVENAAPITPPAETTAETPIADAPPAPAARPSRWWIAAAAVVLIALAAGIAHWRNPAGTTTASSAASAATSAATTRADMLAVLPAGIEADPEWSWLRLGVMDLVATRLHSTGLATTPSDNVVTLLREHGAVPPSGDDVRAATGARNIVQPHVTHHGKGWRVRLDLESTDTAARSVQADGTDPIETARTATDRLLAMLGKAPPGAGKSDALSSTALQQRIEAAILGDDFTEARRLIDTAPSDWRDTPLVHLYLAQIDWRIGRLDDARAQLEPLLPTLDAKTVPDLRAQALYTLAAIAIRQDRSSDALPLLEEAAVLAARNDDSDMLGQAHTAIAAADVNLGRFDDAAAGFARARVAYAGNPLALARVDANEGVLDNARGHPAEALPILERAAERFHRYGMFNDLALTVGAEIRARLFLLDNAAALAAADALWSQQTHISNPRSRQSFTLRRAQALAANGKLGEADALLDALSHEIGTTARTGLPGDIASERARLALAKGDANAAVEAARAAIAALPTIDEAPERARAWLTLVRALTERGDGAADELARFADWAQTRAEVPVVPLLATEAAAELAWADRKRDEAYRLFDDAIARAEHWTVPQDLAIVATGYGARLIAAGEVERAAAVIGRVGRWADQDFDCALLHARLYRALGQTDAWRSALERARALAGERSLPKDVAESPADAHGAKAAFEHTAQAMSSTAHPAIMLRE